MRGQFRYIVEAACFCGQDLDGAVPFLCYWWKKKRHFGISNSELLVAFIELVGKSPEHQEPGEDKDVYSMISGQNP